ncbi:hypothetical protein G7Y89_g15691 [Cudoniella acicularis]|uniref:NmrA-like domain-containing protein n=1 Tax=Cudoniella acicularis TaxID=354080 RepID=A0A8H4VI33_9HELO|nr:hypothetical protein G7Y89_g15691 [Cudoniella acicularis]
MSSKKILVVFGATGNQGGSVIDAMLKDPAMAKEYSLRAVTRDPTKPTAVALTERGVAVFKGNLDNKESLRAVMKDAYACFAVTNWQEIMDKEREIQQGKNIADIAKESNIKHLIWSSLPHVSKITNNEITKVLHFDSKAIVENYIREQNIPATFLHLGVFPTMTIQSIMPVPGTAETPTPQFPNKSDTPPSKKAYVMPLPIPATTRLPIFLVNSSTGSYVKAALSNTKFPITPPTVIACGEGNYSLSEIAAILSEEGDINVRNPPLLPQHPTISSQFPNFHFFPVETHN